MKELAQLTIYTQQDKQCTYNIILWHVHVAMIAMEMQQYIPFLLLFTLTFRHCASCILGQAFHYSPENAFYIFNQQIYFII